MAKKARTQPPKSFVLDNSITMVWAFEDETDPYAEAVADCLPEFVVIVPMPWRLEVANALLVAERRKKISEAKITQFLSLLDSFPITVDEQTVAKAWVESLNIARVHNLSLYDATYLELALRKGLPLASLDGPLKTAAAAVGVDEFNPY